MDKRTVTITLTLDELEYVRIATDSRERTCTEILSDTDNQHLKKKYLKEAEVQKKLSAMFTEKQITADIPVENQSNA